MVLFSLDHRILHHCFDIFSWSWYQSKWPCSMVLVIFKITYPFGCPNVFYAKNCYLLACWIQSNRVCFAISASIDLVARDCRGPDCFESQIQRQNQMSLLQRLLIKISWSEKCQNDKMNMNRILNSVQYNRFVSENKLDSDVNGLAFL